MATMQHKKNTIVGVALYAISIFVLFPHSASCAEKKIALINNSKTLPFDASLVGIKAALRAGGYADVSLNEFNIEQQRDALARIQKEKYDLIVVVGTSATREVSAQIQDIPIVFTMVLNPVASKVIDSMEATGKNITGVALDIQPRLQFELMLKIIPGIKRIGLLYSTQTKGLRDEAIRVGQAMGLTIVSKLIHDSTEVPGAVRTIGSDVDILWVVPDLIVCTRDTLPYLLNYSLENKVPLAGFASYLTKAGAIFSNDYDYQDLGRQAGELMVKIFDGAAAGSLAPVVPRKLRYTLNKRSMAQLRLDIPPVVINEAEEVY